MNRHGCFARIGRHLLAATLVILTAHQGGCALFQQPIPETARPSTLGRVMVVAARQAPDIDFDLLLSSKPQGAVIGAGGTFLGCLGGLGSSGCSGESCGFVAVFWLGLCSVASVAGGIAGAIAAPHAADVTAAESAFSTSLDAATVQIALRHQIEVAASLRGEPLASGQTDQLEAARLHGDYRTLAGAGIDTVLEVSLSKTGIVGAGSNGQLYMTADVRAIRSRDNGVTFTTRYSHYGERAPLSEWSANGGERLLRALQRGYESLGTHIYENVFLLYPLPDWKPHMGGALSSTFGLAPVEPKTRGQLSGDKIIGSRFEWTTVDDLQPVLRWQRFPRETDRAAAAAVMERVEHVRYDLVIARERNLAPAEIVYRRTGLADTAHRIEVPLSPGANYFWTVRAAFELDGRQRVTEWGSTYYAARDQMTAPSRWSYRFRTRK